MKKIKFLFVLIVVLSVLMTFVISSSASQEYETFKGVYLFDEVLSSPNWDMSGVFIWQMNFISDNVEYSFLKLELEQGTGGAYWSMYYVDLTGYENEVYNVDDDWIYEENQEIYIVSSHNIGYEGSNFLRMNGNFIEPGYYYTIYEILWSAFYGGNALNSSQEFTLTLLSTVFCAVVICIPVLVVVLGVKFVLKSRWL